MSFKWFAPIIFGNESGKRRITSLQNPWNVKIPTRYPAEPIISTSLLRIENTPDSVKVSASMLSGVASVFCSIFAMRSVRICVLPVPGPAITITGPSIASTACLC